MKSDTERPRKSHVDLRTLIRDVPDFPKQGILFRDITPLLQDSEALREVIERLSSPFRKSGITKVVGIESRGYIFAPAIAANLQAGFVPVRKPGKLPWKTAAEEYALEYGKDRLEIHLDAIARGERVLIVDDLLATGGTAAATRRLVERLGGETIAAAFLVELTFLEGRARLLGVDVLSLITF
ncbi:MAG TPA: adenine phosphoribosyltransferase [Dongiaceae bacterium]|nr:adenine phosphoribosyltransferase [Dongiaceae bacterium]